MNRDRTHHRLGPPGTLPALVDALLPHPEADDVCTADELTAEIVRLVPHFPAPLRLVLRIFLHLVELSPPLALRRAARFSRLGREERRRISEKLLHSRALLLRNGMQMVNALVTVHFYDAPAVRRRLGYSIEEHVRQVNAPVPIRARDTLPRVATPAKARA
jgi:hypothetical protein